MSPEEYGAVVMGMGTSAVSLVKDMLFLGTHIPCISLNKAEQTNASC